MSAQAPIYLSPISTRFTQVCYYHALFLGGENEVAIGLIVQHIQKQLEEVSL